MEIVNKFLTKVGTDKFLHFLVGALITAYASMINSFFLWGSLLFVFIISIIKEKCDDIYDKKDIISGVLGSILSIILYYIL